MGTRPGLRCLGSLLLLGLWSLSGGRAVDAHEEVSFLARRDFGVGSAPVSVTVGDFNADGRADLATANLSDTVSILLNTSATVVNARVAFVPLPATFRTTSDATGCLAGFVGTFRFRARLTPRPTSPPLTRLAVVVTTLTRGNLLQNAEGGPTGTGAHLHVPRQAGFADEVLLPGESVKVPLVICLKTLAPFRLFVDVRGATP